MLKDGKQERTVVHLELNGSHFYYGNLKALCDNWGKNDIGISYNYLKIMEYLRQNPMSERNV